MGQIKVTYTPIEGLAVIEPAVHGDSRGYIELLLVVGAEEYAVPLRVSLAALTQVNRGCRGLYA